jgi:hypothetical protein
MGFNGDGVDKDRTEAWEDSGESYFDDSNKVNVISVGMVAWRVELVEGRWEG